MAIFTSVRERRLWIVVFFVLVAILTTLFIGSPLAVLFADQGFQAIIFVLGMMLVGVSILIHGIRTEPGKIEIAVLLGITVVYMMLFLRLGLPERSHLMEYSILAIFVHKAILERKQIKVNIKFPALIAFLLSFLVGVLDECIQYFLPDRVFDLRDIVFNGFAVFFAIGFNVIYKAIKKRLDSR